MSSEFGKGLTYCLGLFLCHSERKGMIPEDVENDLDKKMSEIGDNKDFSYTTEMWFNGASDHLYELQIPNTLPVTLKKRLSKLATKSINWGHGFSQDCKKEDKTWAIQEAKDLLRLIDKSYGIKSMKGQWE